MKIIVTGSLGHISSPLATKLLAAGHAVTVVSSNQEKRQEIEAMGAAAAIGSVTDDHFMAETCSGADALYCMTPPNFNEVDQLGYYERVATAYARAITLSGLKRVVNLSSYGAHLPSGTGIIAGSYRAEQILNALTGIQLTHIRPGYFYYNLSGFIPMIKSASFIGNVYGESDRLPLVAPEDIAGLVAVEITQVDGKHKVRYVYSDDRSCSEIAAVLGRSIGKPDLKWHILPEEQVLGSLLENGLPENLAKSIVELSTATHRGILREELDQAQVYAGALKLEEFAKTFSTSYYKS